MSKVLLADDNVTIHKVVELVLPDEYELRSAINGAEALKLLHTFRPDVVLADIEMPVMDGYQLCEEIKGNPETAAIPVVLLAGAFEPIDEELARRSGADGYLVKPFEASELRSKIEGLLKAPAVEEEVEAMLAEEDLALLDEELLFEGEKMLGADEIALEEMPVEEALAEEIAEEKGPVAPQVILPEEFDAELLAGIFKEAVNARVSEVFRTVDFKELLLEAGIKDALEGVLWEVVPELTEKLVKEALADTLASLRKQLENVIWETVPDLAESLIRKEIENIRAESR